MQTASGHELVPWNPSAEIAQSAEEPRNAGGWALMASAFLFPTPSRTLDRAYTSAGKVLEKQANRAAHTLGLGPHVLALKIKSHFEDGDKRIQHLELLRTSIPPKIDKWSIKLMKYALPTESARTQRQAFKDIVDLVTLFPGLRTVFIPPDSDTSMDTVATLWDRSTSSTDDEWTFWQTLAATCLTDTTISPILEGTPVTDLSNCQDDGLSVIDHLLIEHDSSGASKYSKALCLRYLGGVLSLPGFWLNMGIVHSHVAKKLCCEITQVLKDIGVDILTLGPPDELESFFDYEGVDFLASTLLTGFSAWFTKLDQGDWSRQSWYESFCEFIQLLWRPRAAELLPQSSASAASRFENIVPLVYEDAELNIIIDNENETETGPLPDASLAEFYHQNDSNPGISMPDDTVDVQSRHSTQERTDRNRGFDEDSTEIPIRSGGYESDEDSSELIEEWDDKGFSVYDAENFELDTGQNSEVLRDSVIEIQASQHTTLHPRLEALLKQQDEYKLSLLEIQRQFGDHHPDTLQVMENLAYIHHQLGEFRLARALQVVVLEKRTISLGDDDPVTLHIMGALGDTYHSLGQFNKAEELKMSVLEKRTQVLSKDHPDTLLAMSSLASTYQETWKMRRAEPLLTVALDKQLKILGDNSPDTFRTMSTLALTYGQLGKSKKAEELYNEVLRKQCALLGEHHPDTLWTMGHLASQYHALRQVNRAQKLYIEVLEKNRRVLGEAHPDTLWTMAGLASTYHDLGELRKADWFSLSVLEKQRKVEAPNIESQFKHAEKLFVAALERQREILGDSHRRTLWTIRNLALTYESLGKLQEMEDLEALLRQSV